MLRVYNFVTNTKTLGPYNRFALWTQGCLFDCAGCMTVDAQDINGGVEIDVKELAIIINSLKDIEGITITGGEPFLQLKELNNLLNLIDNLAKNHKMSRSLFLQQASRQVLAG